MEEYGPEVVDKYHKMVCDELERVVEKYKVEAGFPDAKIKWV